MAYEEYSGDREEKVCIRFYIPGSEIPKLEKLRRQAYLLGQIRLSEREIAQLRSEEAGAKGSHKGHSAFFNWTMAIANEHLKQVYKQSRGIR